LERAVFRPSVCLSGCNVRKSSASLQVFWEKIFKIVQKSVRFFTNDNFSVAFSASYRFVSQWFAQFLGVCCAKRYSRVRVFLKLHIILGSDEVRGDEVMK